ncbi:hypothetical protein [Methanoregula formicica]|uniref:Uncharacterized protein n=1 Tax=Methanoregula formicica (strain DSM 22288 / NBRC 105244 / SMSP) TaxID=593750 RepID=L0HGT4_METFS|nr:hypothetical protein [Methanoregula formicica]AGB03205.1 hypothetical protein Metfor_2199 [Methanoregula formicica SMSP]
MDTHSADLLKDQLILFRQSVSEAAKNLSGSSGPGSWHAGAPFAEKCRILDLLHSSSLPPEEKTIFVQEYQRIVEELDALLDRHGQVYCNLLLVELRNLVHAYHAETCLSSYWRDTTCVRSGRERRELIGELLEHLSSHYPLSALEALVATIDDNAVLDEVVMTDHGTSEDFRSPGLLKGSSPERDAYCCGETKLSARHV